MINQVPELFGDVKVSFENHDDIGEGTRSKMLSILQDPTKKVQFKGRDGYCSLLWKEICTNNLHIRRQWSPGLTLL